MYATSQMRDVVEIFLTYEQFPKSRIDTIRSRSDISNHFSESTDFQWSWLTGTGNFIRFVNIAAKIIFSKGDSIKQLYYLFRNSHACRVPLLRSRCLGQFRDFAEPTRTQGVFRLRGSFY